jgi:diaminopimelate decarboxylase
MSQELLQYRNSRLHWNGVDLSKLQLKSTPSYIYSRQILQKRAELFKNAFPRARVHYAMKANYFSSILKEFLKMGFHVDVVSSGEIEHALKQGFRPDQILFSGVGKTKSEIKMALENKIFQINLESEDELQKIIQTGLPANIGLRWTPGLDVKTHQFIKTSHTDTKFGLSFESILKMIPIIRSHKQLKLQGISLHLGSQLQHVDDFKMAFQALKELINETGITFETLDLGGGLGIDYQSSDISKDEQLLNDYKKVVDEAWAQSKSQILFEPGRFLTVRSGGLITEVQAVKKTKNKTIVVVDAGMNNLIRPVLYQAYHGVWPIELRSSNKKKTDIVGPICESSDFLALERELPELQVGDLVWIADTGAYGSSMMSDYNMRGRAPEVFIEDL